jgi:hypothetical protein
MTRHLFKTGVEHSWRSGRTSSTTAPRRSSGPRAWQRHCSVWAQASGNSTDAQPCARLRQLLLGATAALVTFWAGHLIGARVS